MGKNKGESINKLYQLNDELQDLLDQESDLYKKATDNRKNILTINRDDKEIEVEEGELWEEVRIAGAHSNAAETLKVKYPEVFEVALKREAKNKELHDFVLKEFGFNFRQMTLADYLKITDAVVDYKLSQK